jgi:hypothetical protein
MTKWQIFVELCRWFLIIMDGFYIWHFIDSIRDYFRHKKEVDRLCGRR